MGDHEQQVLGTGDSDGPSEDIDFVVRAAEAGYFEVPRETPLRELAGEADISDVEASERIRRGVKEIVGQRADQE